MAISHLVANSSPTRNTATNSHSTEQHTTGNQPLISLQEQPHASDVILSSVEHRLINNARSFISSSSSSSVQSSRRKSVIAFQEYADSLGIPTDEPGFIGFIQEKILPISTSRQSVQNVISHIDVTRRLNGQQPFQSRPLTTAFKEAIAKSLSRSTSPSCIDILNISTVIRSAIAIQCPQRSITLSFNNSSQSLPLSNFSFSLTKRLSAQRLKTLILLRCTALLRSVDCSTIVRSSIKQDHDPLGNSIVVFTYRGKAATLNNIPSESNYVEFHADLTSCPATAMIHLKRLVDSLNPDHDRLFCQVRKPFGPLSSQRTASVIRDHLITLKQPITRAHSLRTAASEFLRLNGVPPSDTDLRGGWKPKNCSDSAVRRLHYSYRFSSRNFAEIISRAANVLL
jgi:hypothetical protein